MTPHLSPTAPDRVQRRLPGHGFTLIELMVSMAILSLMLVLVFQMLDETQKTWSRAKGMVSSFKEARNGFEAMNRNITQATLNAYLGYDTGNGLVPKTFARKSELSFVCGPASGLLGKQDNGRYRITHAVFFTAPLGFQTIERQTGTSAVRDQFGQMDQLLNGWGYYIEYGSDKPERPPFLSSLSPPVPERYRFRLMEFRQPAEATTIYQYHLDSQPKLTTKRAWEWFSSDEFGVASSANLDPVASAGQIKTTRPVADNILALIISPRIAETDASGGDGGGNSDFTKATDIAPEFYYDSRSFQLSDSGGVGSVPAKVKEYSRHQLPPVLNVTMVAIDEVDVLRYSATKPDQTELPGYAPGDDMFRDVRKFDQDLQELKDTLTALSIRHRVFTSNIRMREANFTRSR